MNRAETDAAASTVGRRRPLRTDPLSRQGRNSHRSFRAREGAATIAAYLVALATLVIATPTAPRRPATLDHAVLIPPAEYVRTPIFDRSPDDDRASRGVPRETPTTTEPPATATTIRARQRQATTTTTATPAAVDEWGLPPLLRRIGGCESGTGPTGPLVWTAYNHHGSTASGAFQILDSTFQTWQRTYGDGRIFARAMNAPPDFQILVAVGAFRAQGTRPWAASQSCWR